MERMIVATLHRKREAIWSRRYSRLNTAIPRLTYHALEIGEPGDVMELYHAVTGLQIGTIRLKVGNKLEANWVWDEWERS